MPHVRSSWLVGSVEQLIQQDLTIDGGAETIAAGPWYLTHATASISLLAQMVTRMTAAGVAAPAAVLLENRRVRLSSSGTFTVTWGTAALLQEFLGFTGNLSGASSYEATDISPYLWSPGTTATRDVVPDVAGYDVEDAEIKVSVDGTTQETDHHATHVWDEWKWDAVIRSRYDAPSEPGGVWTTFRRRVVVPGHRIQLYESVVEDSSSTDPVTLPAALSTYRMREIPGKGRRKLSNAHTYWTVGMRVRTGSEYP